MTTKRSSRKICIVTMLLLFGGSVVAQNAQIDSLKKEYNKAIKSGLGDMLKGIDSLTKAVKTASDTNRVNTLNNLSNAYRWINSDTGIVISTQAYEEAKKLQYKTGMMRATRISMLTYMNRGDFNKYEEYARKSVPLLQDLKNDRLLYDSYMRIGQCLYQKCKYTEAISYYQKGLDVVLQNNQNNHPQIIVFNILIGNSLLKSGNFEKAYEHFKRAFEHSSMLKDPAEVTTAVGYAYEAMGDLYLKFDDLETAKYYYDKCPEMVYDDQQNKTKYKVNLFVAMKNFDSALVYYRKYSQSRIAEWKLITPDSILLNNFILGSSYMYGPINVGIKEFDKGIAYLKPALAFYSRNGQTEKKLGTLEDLSKAYLAKSDFKTAGQYADELVNIAGKVEAKSNLRNGYQLLSEIYEKSGNKDKANLYYRKYAELKDELRTDEFKQKLKLYKAEEEEKRKTGAIKQLQKEKQWLSIGIILLATTVASFFSFIWVQRKYNAKKRLLEKKELALKQADDERRIASLEMMALRSQMNPHFIFNCLNSINRFVLRNDNEAASNYLTKFSKLMRMVLENSKQSLIPLEEEVKCLELYIQMEQFRCKNAFSYYIKYQDGINRDEAMVPPLLLQPFVENAIWHGINPKGNGGEIGIEFFQKNEALYCIIKDNGIGRKKASELKSQLAENHKSLGLQITQERLSLFEDQKTNGPVQIDDLYDENGSPSGTSVTLRILSLPTFEQLKPSLNL